MCVCACALTVHTCNTYTNLHCCEVCRCELCSVVTVMTSCPLSPVADEIVQQICEAVALLFSNDSSYEFCLDGLMVRVFTWSVFLFECSVYTLGEQLVLILNSYFTWGSLSPWGHFTRHPEEQLHILAQLKEWSTLYCINIYHQWLNFNNYVFL